MTSKKSPSTAKPQTANNTRNRDNPSRGTKEPTDEKNREDDEEADTESDTDAADGEEGNSDRSVTAGSTKAGDTAGTKPYGSSSLIMQLVGSFVGDNLQDAIASVKTKVSEQMAVHGGEYLDSAKTHLMEATEKVVAWGKKHPVQAVAAATALIGVSAFLYATLRGKGDREGQKQGAKGQT